MFTSLDDLHYNDGMNKSQTKLGNRHGCMAVELFFIQVVNQNFLRLLANGKIMKWVAKVLSIIQMEMFVIMANGNTINGMGKVFNTLVMAVFVFLIFKKNTFL